jgi:hypothetical protein
VNNKKISWLKVINIKILISFLWGWRAFYLLTASWCSLSRRHLLCTWWCLRWYLACLISNRSGWLFCGRSHCLFYLNCISSFSWSNSFFMLRNLWIFARRLPLWYIFNLNLRNLTFASSWRFWRRWLNLDWLLTAVLRVFHIRLLHLGVLVLLFFRCVLFFFSFDRCSFMFSVNSSSGDHLLVFFLIFFLGVVFFFRLIIFFISWGFYIVGVVFYSLWMLRYWRFTISLSLRLRLNGAIVYFFKVLVKVLAEHLRLFNGDF